MPGPDRGSANAGRMNEPIGLAAELFYGGLSCDEIGRVPKLGLARHTKWTKTICYDSDF